MRSEGSTMAVRDRFERLPLPWISYARVATSGKNEYVCFLCSAAKVVLA
jgi:hypothetical protein